MDQGPCPVCVNPAGYTHKIICLGKELRGARVMGQPSAEFTWFPGYAWQGIACGCGEMHLVRSLPCNNPWLDVCSKTYMCAPQPLEFWQDVCSENLRVLQPIVGQCKCICQGAGRHPHGRSGFPRHHMLETVRRWTACIQSP